MKEVVLSDFRSLFDLWEGALVNVRLSAQLYRGYGREANQDATLRKAHSNPQKETHVNHHTNQELFLNGRCLEIPTKNCLRST